MKIYKLFGLLVIFIITIAFSSCSNQTADKAAADAIKAVKRQNLSDIEKYYGNTSGLLIDFEDTLPKNIEKLLTNSLKYEIKNVTVNGNTATAEIKITNLNLKRIFERYEYYLREKSFSSFHRLNEDPNEKYDHLRRMLKNEYIEPVTSAVTVDMVYEDGWKAVYSPDLGKALFGGFSVGGETAESVTRLLSIMSTES